MDCLFHFGTITCFPSAMFVTAYFTSFLDSRERGDRRAAKNDSRLNKNNGGLRGDETECVDYC